jgi:hypothetical protein
VSLLVSTQASPQATKPAPHLNEQAPAIHVGVPFEGAEHSVAHEPQCAGSFFVSTQAPPQSVVPAGHWAAQAPGSQVAPAPQAFPQAPQLVGLEVRSTQVPLQSV